MTDKPMTDELDDAITNIFVTIDNFGTGAEARDDIKVLIAREVVKARIDQLNRPRNSDVKINHSTIELMGYMSQQLNKEKQKLQEPTDKRC